MKTETLSKKQGNNILIVLLIILILYAIYEYNRQRNNGTGDSSDEDCVDRPLIECWTGCSPTFLPDREVGSPPESSMFRSLECGTTDACADSSQYPNTQPPACPPPIDDEGGGDFDINDDTYQESDEEQADEDFSFDFDTNDDIYGCMTASALNYNPNATIDDNSCTWASTNDVSYFACCDPSSSNFDPSCASNYMCNCTSTAC